MAVAVSPLAPKSVPAMPPIAGVRLATAAAGIKYANRTDVLLALLAPGTAVAGVFTKSKCPSAPVEWCRANLKHGKARALVVNSGNANAFTGKTGRQACQFTAKIAASAIGCKPADIFLASTGVIGEPLNANVVRRRDGRPGRRGACGAVAGRREGDHDHRHLPQGRDRDAQRSARPTVTINGIAKGAGMIAPDMATMLSFIFTDAPIGRRALQSLLSEGVTDTFNAVTIDGDTSTSDTLLAFATGAAIDAPRISSAADPRLKHFRAALNTVLANLAEQVARDGEGARKLVEIKVEGAKSKASARRIAMSIANSPLVKTAIAGEDANWGRVVMAVGKAGEPADRDKLSIWFNGIRVAHKGARDPAYDEGVVRKR